MPYKPRPKHHATCVRCKTPFTAGPNGTQQTYCTRQCQHKRVTRRRYAATRLARQAIGTAGTQPWIATANEVLGNRPSSALTARDCAWCGTSFRQATTWQVFCTLWCKRRNIRERRRSRQSATPEWQTWTHSQFMSMARGFNYRCAYCGEKPDRLDPDHVVPLSRGGSNTLGNLLPTCLPCNSDKRDLLLGEWNADRERRGLPPRSATWATGDHRYSHLTVASEPAAA